MIPRPRNGALFLLLLLAIACSPLPKKDWVKGQIDELLAKYQEKNEELAKRWDALASDAPGIRQFDLEFTDGKPYLTISLDRAPLDVIIRRCLKESRVSFLYEGAGPHGRVTASFKRQPLIRALNLLLEPFDYETMIQGNVFVIRERPIGQTADEALTAALASGEQPFIPLATEEPMPKLAAPVLPGSKEPELHSKIPEAPHTPHPSEEAEKLPAPVPSGPQNTSLSPSSTAEKISIYRVVTPLYITANYVLTNILNNIYPSNSGNSVLQYGIVPETNQIFLYGAAEEVSRAVRMIRDADQEPVHIYFEGVIVAFSSEASEVVGSALQNLAYKQLSGVNLAAGFPSSPTFVESGVFTIFRDVTRNNPLSFDAIIDALVNINQARVLSRPYLFALSGNQATLNIGDQGYVQITSSVQGGLTTSSSPITVGTQLTLTPTALPDGTIRLEIDLQQSQLEPASQQLNAEVDLAQTTTVLQVRDGESLLIGGLNLQESTSQSFGFPYLEKIPLLNFFFKSIYNTYFQNQAFFYVTPRIWRPSLDLPVEPVPRVPFESTLNAISRPYE